MNELPPDDLLLMFAPASTCPERKYNIQHGPFKMRYPDLFPHTSEVAGLWCFIDFERYSVFLPQVPTPRELENFTNAVDRVKINPASGRGDTYTIFAQIVAEHGFGVLWSSKLDIVVKSWMELPDLESGYSVAEAFTLAVSKPMIKGIENLSGASAWHKRELLHAWKRFLDRNLPRKNEALAAMNDWTRYVSIYDNGERQSEG